MNGSGQLRIPLLAKENGNGRCEQHKMALEGRGDLSIGIEEEFQVEEKGEGEGEEERRGVENGHLHHVISVFGQVPPLGPQLPIDPFRNHTPWIEGLYEWLKTLICLPILLLRVLLTALVVIVGLVGTKLALAGWTQKEEAMPRWRYRLMSIARGCARCILFCFGFHWIRIRGSPAPREVAPIVVSNHVCFTDPIFFFYALFPSMVSSNSHDDILFVGMIIRSMQMILVDRLLPASRKKAAIEIKRRAVCDDFPRVLLFPEGTTTNGKAIISFKLGAFRPGLPIQPVVVRYPFVHFDCSWGNISLPYLVFRMLTQFNNFMEVEYLPVIVPSAKEKVNPADFAARVRFEMARSLNVPETEHTYGDLMLAVKASQLEMRSVSASMVEMGLMEKLFHLSTSEVKDFLDKFIAMDPARSGYVTMDQFLEALGLPKTVFSKQIFQLFDKSGRGFINFKEFAAVLAYLSRHTSFSSSIRSAFDACDVLNDGLVSLTELEASLRSVFPAIPSSQVQQMLRKLHVDGGNKVSWESFKTFFEKNPELMTVFLAATSYRHS